MSRFIALIIGMVAFSACGQAHQPQVDVGSFSQYVAAFQDAGAKQGKDIQINDLVVKFASLPNHNEAGNCQLVEGETPVITINQDDWAQMDEGKRQELLFHELGHCILRRKHKPGITSQGIPQSVMNPYTIDGAIYTPNAEYYEQELFSSENEF